MSNGVTNKTARRTWATLEPLHGLVYFSPETDELYGALGLDHFRSGYFASRSAALGPTSPEVVIATFFNFEPGLVRRHLDGVWDRTTPEAVVAARFQVIDRALRRALGDSVGGPAMVEAATLARRAAEQASEDLVGRPLFAGHASLPWPDDAHLVLWHAQTLLREHRGDGHVAALLSEGLDGVGALVSHAATGDVPASVLRTSRGWDQDAWSTAMGDLRARGLLTGDPDPTFTAEGAAHRKRIEDRTDANAAPAYSGIGEHGCERLRELGRPMAKAALSAYVLPTEFI
ncbi:MAG TPA: hypothetical protein VJM33_01330 [Microthrixaceae bacterium]|nr:hypothetical protein [Microthrixaceae bacterium]